MQGTRRRSKCSVGILLDTGAVNLDGRRGEGTHQLGAAADRHGVDVEGTVGKQQPERRGGVVGETCCRQRDADGRDGDRLRAEAL